MTNKNCSSFVSAIVFLGVSTFLLSSCSTITKSPPQISQSWSERWDNSTSLVGVENNQSDFSIPIISAQSIRATKRAIQTYSEIVENGGWPKIPTTTDVLQMGSVGPAVALLRERLTISGDLPNYLLMSDIFDSYVEKAVRRYQMRNGLKNTGVVDSLTLKVLNISAQSRLTQLKLNLSRIEKAYSLIRNEQRYVFVNIPSTHVEAVANGAVEIKFLAIVGQISRQTPLLDSQIYQIILNPTWTIPQSIIKEDLIPLIREDPSYLEKNNIFIYNSRGNRVPPNLLDWNSLEPLGYRFKQEPGKNNAMASSKINFYNKYDVYMHDTPSQSGFVQDMLFDSSGCIRVQNVRDLDVWLMNNQQGWTRKLIYDRIASGKTTLLQLQKKVPVHFSYISAWSPVDGMVNFRNDIYKKDGIHELNFITGSITDGENDS